MLRQLLIPPAVLELDSPAAFGCFADHHYPRFGDLGVGFVFFEVVLGTVPAGEVVDDLRGAVEVAERGGCLGFVGREEVGCEVVEGFEEVNEGLTDTVVRVVGGGIASEWE